MPKNTCSSFRNARERDGHIGTARRCRCRASVGGGLGEVPVYRYVERIGKAA